MKILLILGLIFITARFQMCSNEPQRTFYMSFPSLSKRDALNNLFADLNKKMSTYNNSYTDSVSNIKIINFQPELYYNDHYQSEAYKQKFIANVTMGIVQFFAKFDYVILGSDSKMKNGYGITRANLDPSYFTKKLSMNIGYLEWVSDIVPPLTLTQLIEIEATYPKVTETELDVLRKMINNQAGQFRIKQLVIEEINSFYGTLLSEYLKHEDLIANTNITYTYKTGSNNNITLNLNNIPKQFELSNDKTKGLEVFFLFGLDSNKDNCTKLPRQFDEDQYGGLQEIISFNTVRSMIKQAISKGLFDINFDKIWQVPHFQFYMGDLGNFVEYANNAPAGDRFTPKCVFDKSRMDNELKITKYEEHQIYVSAPEYCVINYLNKDIFRVDFDFNTVVELVGLANSIRATVVSTGVYGIKYTSLDSNYALTSISLLQFAMSEVLNGLVGKTVFGNDFPAIYRRYPVVRVQQDYLILFDPSEK